MKEYQKWLESTMDMLRQKMTWVAEKNKNKIPYTTDENGDYDDKGNERIGWGADDGLNWWTNGFWPGILWLLYQDTGEKKYVEWARYSQRKIEKCLDDFYGLHHDVGFMFQLSSAADWRLTGDRQSRKTALHAATLLAGRFNLAGRFIRAWNDLDGEDTRGWGIIDCMMNLSLLYFASEETKDPRFSQVATAHADTVMKYFMRRDGSVCHIAEFDPVSGEFVKERAGQGYSDDSAWSRGQGWAVYGFVISYIHTGDRRYLETAKRVAGYIIKNLKPGEPVPVDFRQPSVLSREDSCGACVIACGLLELSFYLEGREKEEYRTAALDILIYLSEYRADWGKGCDAIIQNCSASYYGDSHHITMNYADYFFMEALYKLNGTGQILW